MSRFSKSFTLPISDKNSTAARMIHDMKLAEDDCRGSTMRLMRKYMQSGYLLEQIGKSLGDSLLNMDREGLFDSMEKKQQAKVLIKLLEQKIWQYELMESVESAKKPQPVRVEPVRTEPVTQPTEAVVEPPKKKRKRPANILS